MSTNICLSEYISNHLDKSNYSQATKNEAKNKKISISMSMLNTFDNHINVIINTNCIILVSIVLLILIERLTSIMISQHIYSNKYFRTFQVF